MSNPRAFFTTAAMVVKASLLVVVMLLVWILGHDLMRLKAEQADLAATVQQMQKVQTEITALTGELSETRRRLQEVEAAAKAEPPGPAPVPVPAPHPVPAPPPPKGVEALPPAARARTAFTQRGFAGFAEALGLGRERQARLVAAYDELMPRLHAAEKAHSKVTIEGDAVQVHITPFPEEAQALRREWQETLVLNLTPEQLESYARAEGDTMVFGLAFADWDQEITLTRDAMGIKMKTNGHRVGPGNANMQSSSTISGANAVDRLPCRHLLTDEVVAKLGGAAQP